MQNKLLQTQATSTPIKRTERYGDMAVRGAVQFSSSRSLQPSAFFLKCSDVKCSIMK